MFYFYKKCKRNQSFLFIVKVLVPTMFNYSHLPPHNIGPICPKAPGYIKNNVSTLYSLKAPGYIKNNVSTLYSPKAAWYIKKNVSNLYKAPGYIKNNVSNLYSPKAPGYIKNNVSNLYSLRLQGI